MNPNTPNPKLAAPELTVAQLDAAFSSDQDGILPSSGFADAVMTAVVREAAAPAPIPFPWKRALPLLVAVVGALALVITACVAILHAKTASAASFGPALAHWQFSLAPILRNTAGSDTLWVLFSLTIPVLCLLLMRRLLFSR
jgi:hypothetical protein